MKFIFIDKSDKECDIITDILSSYNVLYRIHTKHQKQFCYVCTTYDIEINVEPEFYEYLCKEIQPKLDEIKLLEDCYELPSFVKDEDREEQEKQPNLKEDNELPSISDMIMGSIFEHLHGVTKQEGPVSTLVKFDDLPDELKEQLLRRMPENMLRSKNCIIRKTPFGISVEYKGGANEE